MKTIKAWAIMQPGGHLGEMGNGGLLYIGTNQEVVECGIDPMNNERVVRVTIAVEEE